jgi:hypothetical protein
VNQLVAILSELICVLARVIVRPAISDPGQRLVTSVRFFGHEETQLNSSSVKFEVCELVRCIVNILEGKGTSNLLEETETFVEKSSSPIGVCSKLRGLFELLLGLEDDDIVGAAEATASAAQSIGDGVDV